MRKVGVSNLVRKAHDILSVSALLLISLVMSPVMVSAGDTLSVAGPRFLLDGNPFDMWGVRTVNALWNDAQTQEFLTAMADYAAHGVNTVGVNLQGGYPGYEKEANGDWYSNSAFNTDGSLKPEYMERVRLILERARDLDIVVNVGYFYQRQCRKAALTNGLDYDHWDSDEAIYEATRNATEWLLPYRHVFLDIVNEYGHAGYQYKDVFPELAQVGWTEYIARAQVLVDLVHEVDPDRLCGISICSGQDPLDIPGAEIAYTHGLPQTHKSGDKPQVNNEQLFRGSFGVYDEATKVQIMNEAQTEHDNGNFWFWGSGWHQFYPFNFHLGGQGTEYDPGDRWIYEHIAEITSQVNVTLLQPQGSSFDVLEPVDYEGEAYNPQGLLITDDNAYQWYYDKIGVEEDVYIGSGRSGSVSFYASGIYLLKLKVTYDGQVKIKSKNLYIGQVLGQPIALGVQGKFPAITVDDAGRTHLVYANAYGVYYMTYDYNGWSTPELIPNSTGAFYLRRKLLDITTDSEGDPHVVWFINNTLQYVTLNNGTWTSPIEALDDESKGFAIAADSDDTIWLVYRAFWGATEGVFARRKTAGDMDFDDFFIVYFDGSERDNSYPDIAAGKDGAVHFLWRWDDLDGSNFDPFYRRFKSGNWYDPETVDNSERSADDGLAIAMHPDGTPRVVYYDGVVRTAKPEYGYWSRSNTRLEWTREMGDQFAVIAVDDVGRIYVVSHHGHDKNGITETDSVYYTIYDPYLGAWGAIHHIDDEAQIATGQPAVAAGDSCVHVVWMDIEDNLYHRILGDVPSFSNQAPVAVITATPSSGLAELRVEFNGCESYDPDGQIVSYFWEFGDGDTSHQINPVHVYEDALGFEPRLYVRDNGGESSMTFVYIEAHDFTPSISCTENDVILSWDEEQDVDHYKIYRESDPYFTPLTPIAVVTETEYIDAGIGADPMNNHYYVIEAVRPEPCASVMSRLAKMSQPLSQGLNLVSLPVIPANTSLSEVLGETLTGGVNVLDSDRIMKWNGNGYDMAWLMEGSGTQWDGTWFNEEGSALSELTLEPDEGFWVDVRPGHPQVNLLLLGQISSTATRNVDLGTGMNLVGFSYPVPMALEESGLNQVVTGGLNSTTADRILVWTGQGYEIAWYYHDGNPASNGIWFNEIGSDTTTVHLEPFKGFWLHIRDGHPTGTWQIPNPNTGN